TNVANMYKSVRLGLMKKLKEVFAQYTDKEYRVDLTQFTNKSGVEFTPKSISIHQEAYLLINLDIERLNYSNASLIAE
ncbi:hypothetical protein ABK046_47145, partial [Streptomyces caeruleatus]